MRLGAHISRANTIEALEPLCEKMDALGLSALPAPGGYWDWSDEQCAAYGEKARSLGFVVGEAGYWKSLLDPDKSAVEGHIALVRRMLAKGERMGLKGVVTLVGSRDPGGSLVAHPYNYTKEAKAEFREIVLRLLDGQELKTTRYMTEPWPTSFYYQPEEIREFLESVGDPRVGVHMDQMNMVSQASYFHTTELINRTFDLLAPYVVSVHAKDVRWDPGHLMLKWDEVAVGEGVMDYDTYLRRLDALPADMTVYTEHWKTEEDWLKALECLQRAAAKAGVRFLRRGEIR